MDKALTAYSTACSSSCLTKLRTFLGAHRFPGANCLNRLWGGHDLPKHSVVCSVLGNRLLVVDPSQDMYQRHLFLTGEYEPGTLSLMKEVLRAGDVFVDAGANLGLMTIHAAGLVGNEGTAVAFEPSPTICQSLRQNIALNACTNVEVHQVALGEGSAKATYYARPGANIGSGSLIGSPDAVAQTEVPVRALEDSLDPRHRRRLRLIKIDVEGYELSVLKGSRALLTTSPRPLLCVEHGEDSEARDRPATHVRFMEAVGGYEPFVFAESKFSRCGLVPILKKSICGTLTTSFTSRERCYAVYHRRSLCRSGARESSDVFGDRRHKHLKAEGTRFQVSVRTS